MLSRRLRPAALALGLVLAGCSDDDGPTSASLSQTVVSNVQVRALTAQLAGRNVQYQITATVTHPEGVVGGTAQLKSATAEARKGRAQPGAVVASTPVGQQNVVGTELRVTMTLVQPPAGTLQLVFSVVDARGLESNGVPLVLGIGSAPSTPPASPSIATFVETLGATFQHPRCTNCHGFQIPNQAGINHIGRPPTCSNCHTVPGWHAPDASFSLAGLSKLQICQLIKSKMNNSGPALEHHLTTDPLVQWAIIDGLEPGNLQLPKAPPRNLATWNDRVEQWVDDGLKCD
jgi:hypothetical protein